jgi:hypothetical protein
MLIRFIQIKLFNKKSEIKFGIVIKSTYTPARQNLTDKLSQALSKLVKTEESKLLQRMREENEQ